MSDDGWAALLAGLRELGEVEEVAPGRTVVRYDGRSVTIVMTPDEWDALVGMWFVAVAPAVDAVVERVRGLDPTTPYLVHENYALEPSATPELPRDPAELRVEQWMREHPEQHLHLYAYPPEELR